MSFKTKISFVPRDSGTPSISFESVNYGFGNFYSDIKNNLKTTFKRYKFRELNETGSYTDFICLLSIEEFTKFHFQFFDKTTMFGDKSINEFLITKVPNTRYNWVIIEINEIDF